MELTLDSDGVLAIEAAVSELGFSTDEGGANWGDESAQQSRESLHALLVRLPPGRSGSIDATDLEALRRATQELAFSVEAGGANEGNSTRGQQVELLERLLGRLELADLDSPADTPQEPQVRSRPSDLAERLDF